MSVANAAAGPVLTGERVRLRPMSAEDAPHLVRWAADDEFAWNQWGRAGGRFPDPATAERDFIGRFVPPEARLFAVELAGEEGRPVGFANYRELRPKPKSAEIGIGIGERHLWSQGLGRDAVRTLVRHLVDDLGLHRVSLHTHSENDRAIAAYKACGFEVEGVLRDAVMTDRGRYVDTVAMAYIHGRVRPAFDPRPVTLEGPRLRLEPLRMEHVEELYQAVRDPDIWTWLSWGPPASVDDIRGYVRNAMDAQIRGEHLPWLTRRRSDGRAIGTTRFAHIDRVNRSVEIGYSMLGPDARGTGLNAEAKYLQLRHAFEDLGAIRVWLNTDERNKRSQRAMEKIGATQEARHRQDRVMPNGYIRTSVFYSLIDSDWPEVRRRLEEVLPRP